MNKRTQAILDALDERYGIDVACHLHYKGQLSLQK